MASVLRWAAVVSTSPSWPVPTSSPTDLPASRVAAASAVLAAPDRRWNLLLACLVVYLMTAVGRVHQVFALLEPLHLALVSGALATAYCLLSRGIARRLSTALRFPTTRFVLALAFWMGLSIPGALWPGGAFHLFTDQFLKSVVALVVLAAAVRGIQDVERLAFAYFLSASIYAAVVLTRFNVGGDEWRLGSLYYYDANEFATLAVMCLPLGVYFMVRPRPLWRRLVSVPAVAALAVGFIWTGSRGGFLALLAVGAFLLLRYTAIHARWRILTTALLALVFAAAATDRYWKEMKTVLQPKDDYNLTDEQGRVKVWKRGLGYMLQRPVLGVGADNFPTAEGSLSPLRESASLGRGVKWSVAHNSYLQVGAELGVPGLVFFLAMLGTAVGAMRAVRRSRLPRPLGERSPPAAQLAQALTAALIAYMVGGFFLSLAYHELLYTLIALIVTLRKVTPIVVTRPAPRSGWTAPPYGSLPRRV